MNIPEFRGTALFGHSFMGGRACPCLLDHWQVRNMPQHQAQCRLFTSELETCPTSGAIQVIHLVTLKQFQFTSITSQILLGHFCQIYFPASTLLNSLTLILNNLFQLSVHISSLGRHCPFLGIGRAVSKLKVIGEGSHYIECYSKCLRRASFNYVRQLWQPIQANNIFLQINFLLLFLLQPSTQDARGKEQKEVPMVLLGNKGDMVHLRQVSSEEGDTTILV